MQREAEGLRRWVGQSVKRREDPRLLVGRAKYVDDITLPGMLHVKFLGSPYAHAKIRQVDVDPALRLPGVAATLIGREVVEMTTGRGLPYSTNPLCRQLEDHGIAVDAAQYVGEPVAAVAAVDRSIANDALDLIKVDYEPLPCVVDAEDAMKPGAPQLHKDVAGNIAWHGAFNYGDVEGAFREADIVLSERFDFHRYSSTPLEPWGVLAHFDPLEGNLTIWGPAHGPVGRTHAMLADRLGIPQHKIRLIMPEIGGGFGNKIPVYRYYILLSLLSMKTRRPVKWVAERREDLIAGMHSPNRIAYCEAAVKKDGSILGLKTKIIDNFGAYLRVPEPANIIRPLSTYLGCYRIKNVSIDAYAVLTNKCTTGPNRGYGCNHTYFMLERMVDLIAKRLGMDPAEVRFRNFIQPSEHPYTTPLGDVYESGNYPECLRRALKLIGYEELKKELERLREQGRYIGVGMAAVVEPGASNLGYLSIVLDKVPISGASEAATVKLGPRGKATVLLGTVPQGQGHQTVGAQLVAEELGLSPDDVDVVAGFDSQTHPYAGSSGTYASRFTSTGASALVHAARRVRDKMLAIAAHMLEARVEDLEVVEGRVQVKGVPDRGLPISTIAWTAIGNPAALPKGMEAGLESTVIYNYEFPGRALADRPGAPDVMCDKTGTHAGTVHVGLVEVDPDTFQPKILRYIVVEDSGVILNPMIFDGQVHGAVIHGVGGALYEEHAYGEDGQPLAATFMDYLCPKATESPNIEIEHVITPSPVTPTGAKGMGEGPSIATPVCLANAVEDALKPLGVKITKTPLKPSDLWSLVKKARLEKRT